MLVCRGLRWVGAQVSDRRLLMFALGGLLAAGTLVIDIRSAAAELEIAPFASGILEWNDNVARRSDADEVDAYITRYGGGVEIEGEGLYFASVVYQGTWADYHEIGDDGPGVDVDRLDMAQHSGEFEFGRRFSSRLRIALVDRLVRSRELRNVFETHDRRDAAAFTANSVGTDIDLTLSDQTRIGIEYRWSILLFDDEEVDLAQGVSRDDSQEHSLATRLEYDINQLNFLLFDAYLSRRTVQDSSDYYTGRGFIGYRRVINPELSLELNAGYEGRFFKAEQLTTQLANDVTRDFKARDTHDIVGRAIVKWRRGKYALTGTGERARNILGTNSFYDINLASVKVAYDPNTKLSLGLNATGEWNFYDTESEGVDGQTGIASSANREDIVIRGGANIEYHFAKWVSFSASFHAENRDSNNNSLDMQQNIVSGEIRLTPRRF